MNFSGHKFKKQFGQNFIRDENFLAAIVKDAGITREDAVVEVGPGAGGLTKQLAKAAKNVTAFEIDRDLKPILHENLKGFDNVEIIFGDILKTEINFENYHVVANLPYYITAPVIMKFLESKNPPETLTIMLQKEVAERLTARENTPEYGVFTLAVKLFAEAEITRPAPRKLFYPVPDVDSAVVRLDVAPKFNPEKTAGLKKLIKTAFSMRRKTLANNLSAGLNLSKETLSAALLSAGIPPNVRGEALTLEEFAKLYDFMVK